MSSRDGDTSPVPLSPGAEALENVRHCQENETPPLDGLRVAANTITQSVLANTLNTGMGITFGMRFCTVPRARFYSLANWCVENHAPVQGLGQVLAANKVESVTLGKRVTP